MICGGGSSECRATACAISHPHLGILTAAFQAMLGFWGCHWQGLHHDAPLTHGEGSGRRACSRWSEAWRQRLRGILKPRVEFDWAYPKAQQSVDVHICTITSPIIGCENVQRLKNDIYEKRGHEEWSIEDWSTEDFPIMLHDEGL